MRPLPLSDCHCHSAYSGDAALSNTPSVMIEKAIAEGLYAITLTDHYDLDYPVGEGEHDFFFDTKAYYEELYALKKHYAGRIQVLIGIELGLRLDKWEELNAAAKSVPFDFRIGSVHVVDGLDPYMPAYWEGISPTEGLARYWETMLSLVKRFDCFESLGHLDYIIRYVNRETIDFSAFTPLIDEILSELIKKNKALEVNTAGIKYGLGAPHPSPAVLQRYRALGGRMITIGSDGHKPEHLAYGFSTLPQLLKENGFSSYTLFCQKKPKSISL